MYGSVVLGLASKIHFIWKWPILSRVCVRYKQRQEPIEMEKEKVFLLFDKTFRLILILIIYLHEVYKIS